MINTLLSLLLGLSVAAPPLPAAGPAQAKPASFGSKDPGLFNMKGTLYFLSSETERMPENLASMKPEGVIYTDRLDVPPRDFQEGFPGVTNRFEWFGLL